MQQLHKSRPNMRGQSTVEFALIAPLVVLCALVLLETLSLCMHILSLNDLAHSAVRTAISSQDPSAAVTVFAHEAHVNADTEIDEANGFITVTVHSQHKITSVAILSWLPSVSISAQSTMLREPPTFLSYPDNEKTGAQ